jgi:phenylalanyl-tRNA synthetase beta subunit
VHNYIWFNDNWLKTLEYEPGETLVLKNSTTPETSRLRTTLIPNLLALVPKNRPVRETFRLFESARIFQNVAEPQSSDCATGDTVAGSRNVCTEKHHLAGIAFQRSGSFEDFYLSVKSGIEDVLLGCGVRNVAFKESTAIEYNWQTPGNFVTVYAYEKPLGTLGILDKAMTTKVCREGGQIVWFEIDLDDLAGTLYPETKFEEPPRYPLSWQDFSLLWNVESGFDKLESVLDKFANPLVIRREFLVSYRGKGVEKGSACYSFRFWIGSPDHTLSGEEIETFHQQFLTYIKDNNVMLRV